MGFFWENSQKTCDPFSRKTVRKHVTILPSKIMANCLCVFQEYRQRKRQSVSLGNSWDKDKFFPFVSLENNQGNRLPFSDSNRWNNFILFSRCLRGKWFKCFPGKHILYTFSKAVFLENSDHPQQWKEGIICKFNSESKQRYIFISTFSPLTTQTLLDQSTIDPGHIGGHWICFHSFWRNRTFL